MKTLEINGYCPEQNMTLTPSDYERTNDLKWVKNWYMNHDRFILMQRWKCRFVEKSLPDIWFPVPIEEFEGVDYD